MNDLNKKRYNNLKFIKTIMWIWVLGAFTITIYLPARMFFVPNEPINYYVLAILSGLTGGVWGVGINEVAGHWRSVKDLKEISKDNNLYKKHMLKWIIVGIFTLIYVGLLSFVINYYKI